MGTYLYVTVWLRGWTTSKARVLFGLVCVVFATAHMRHERAEAGVECGFTPSPSITHQLIIPPLAVFDVSIYIVQSQTSYNVFCHPWSHDIRWSKFKHTTSLSISNLFAFSEKRFISHMMYCIIKITLVK